LFHSLTMNFGYFLFVVVLCSWRIVGAELFDTAAATDRPDIQIVQGDIAFPIDSVPVKNAYIRAAKWTNGIVPYAIDNFSGYTTTHKTTITNAMRKIEEQTNNCIKFVPRTNQATWVRIYAGTGCWSYMGRLYSSGTQDLSLQNPACVTQSVCIHELLHAVGFAHEQSRTDRDSHVSINWNNIQSGTESNFNAFGSSEVNLLGKPYDITSVMHYKSTAFSKNGQPTIVPKSGVSPSELGKSPVMTNLDIQKVKAYYNCP